MQQNSNYSDDSRDCAVCLQPRMHPARLPCGHIFCFLCLKGVAFRSGKCAICRQDIPNDYLSHPVLLDDPPPDNQTNSNGEENAYQWFYEGRNGWWKYDERSNVELEEKYASDTGECQLLVAGILYKIDFRSMLQVRLNDASRKRNIKRALPSVPAKGIAGIKFETAPMAQQSPLENTENKNEVRTGPSVEREAADDLEELANNLQSIQLEESVESERSESRERNEGNSPV